MYNIITEGQGGTAPIPRTLVSFQAALDFGVDAFEFDVWLTSDKVPVLMHDATAYRTCGVDKKINDMTLVQVKQLDAGSKFDPAFAGEPVPTLAEVLDLVVDKAKPDFMLGVEIKDYTEECADVTLHLLNARRLTDRCFFTASTRASLSREGTYKVRTMGTRIFRCASF